MIKANLYIGFIFAIFSYNFAKAQNQYQPQKLNTNPIILDGILSPNEWANAIPIELNYEINPGNNSPAKKKTLGYITYTATDYISDFMPMMILKM